MVTPWFRRLAHAPTTATPTSPAVRPRRPRGSHVLRALALVALLAVGGYVAHLERLVVSPHLDAPRSR